HHRGRLLDGLAEQFSQQRRRLRRSSFFNLRQLEPRQIAGRSARKFRILYHFFTGTVVGSYRGLTIRSPVKNSSEFFLARSSEFLHTLMTMDCQIPKIVLYKYRRRSSL